MLPSRRRLAKARVWLVALAALLAAGCRAGSTLAPRAQPVGMPAKLIPAPLEQHPRATPHATPR
jgi:hypothetical protein